MVSVYFCRDYPLCSFFQYRKKLENTRLICKKIQSRELHQSKNIACSKNLKAGKNQLEFGLPLRF